MVLLDWLLGRPLATLEEENQHIGPGTGIPVLGLDALASAAYGPEAALTLLIPLGVGGLVYSLPILAIICAILVIVYLSYRQTIAAYPGGGGSYTVAKENLGPHIGLLAGAALAIDYILNVAVGISAGVGALVSAFPELLPHTLALCLAILGLIAVVNLRGIKESGLAFMLPTYAFVGSLGIVIAVGLVRSLAAGGAPEPVDRPPAMPAAVEVAGAWLVLKAFASGCTAMTGVEAVSNAVPIEPMEMPDRVDPVVVLAAGSWSKMTQQGLKFALRLSDDIYVVQVKTETSTIEDLSDNWELLIANPARKNRITQPRLVILTSQYRQFLTPFVDFIKKLEVEYPDRDIAVVIPDLIMSHWYEGLLHNNRGTFLRMILRAQCSDRVVVISTPFHLRD